MHFAGEGASGFCVVAFHEEDRSDVLLKFRTFNDDQDIENFRNEAKLLKRLRSEHVVEIKGKWVHLNRRRFVVSVLMLFLCAMLHRRRETHWPILGSDRYGIYILGFTTSMDGTVSSNFCFDWRS